jgi:Flp pilus assembly pilin Flp
MLKRSGQSIVEYVVLLALVAILVTTVVASLGQRSRRRFAQANEAIEEADVASATITPASGKPVVGGIAAKPIRERPDGDR